MCCIRGICILAPGANVSANMIFHPVSEKKNKVDFRAQNTSQHNSEKFFSRNFVAQITSHLPNNK